MSNEEIGRRSRWMMRAMEWDDPRARYPNIWSKGMPRHILAFERVASRLRLGDLVAVYYPASQRHPERAEKFLGLSRVTGLRLADEQGFGWIDLDTAHRFDPPLALKAQPRRVFLCCDPGWPGPEVELFRAVFAAAVAAGWEPRDDEREADPTQVDAAADRTQGEDAEPTEADATATPTVEPAEAAPTQVDAGTEIPVEVPPSEDQAVEIPIEAAPEEATPATAESEPAPVVAFESDAGLRMFAGVGYSGDMRDPRDATWLAVAELRDERLKISRLEATGRHGLHGYLRDPDRSMMNVEAIGLDFPFGLPTPFAEKILGGPFPDEGWWALAKRMERMSRPEFLIAIQEFREAEGEVKRLTDELTGAFSPLHRVNPDLGPMTFHGIRMIAEDRSRFAVRPFETAQGKLLLEVYPGAVIRKLSAAAEVSGSWSKSRAVLNALMNQGFLPVDLSEPQVRACTASRDALDAVVAARCAALAVLTGEVDKKPDELASGEEDRVRREGWIYGLKDPD
jgi:hypothetical protein